MVPFTLAAIAACLTVRQYAKSKGIGDEKVLRWIASGELPAINVAQDANGQRPRWRISRHRRAARACGRLVLAVPAGASGASARRA